MQQVVPRHLSDLISQSAWDYIVEKAKLWEPQMQQRGLPEWVITNWLITWAANPNTENRTWIMNRLKQEGLVTSPLDIIELTETLRRD